MRVALAILLLALPAWVVWVMVRARMAPWKRALLALIALATIFGNPLANFFLLAPVDSLLQKRMLARSQGLLGEPEARVREVLGAPWKMHRLDGPFWVMTYAPCRVCMKSYAQPFAVFLESGRVYAFRAGG